MVTAARQSPAPSQLSNGGGQIRRADGGVSLARDDGARLLLAMHSQAQTQRLELIEGLILTLMASPSRD
jgi:hypothetical protein